MSANCKKYFLLGDNPSTIAIGKVLELFGIEKSANNKCDILMMVDGDEFALKGLSDTFNGSETLIYIESEDRDPSLLHPLNFISGLFTTYRVLLEDFSIEEFGRIVVELIGVNNKQEQTEYIPPRSTPLTNGEGIKKILKVLLKTLPEKSENNDLDRFVEYMEDQRACIERLLHGQKETDGSKVEKVKKQVLEFDRLFSILKVPENIELNILVVENDPGSMEERLNELKKASFGGLKFFIVNKNFKTFKEELRKEEVRSGKKELHQLLSTDNKVPNLFKNNEQIIFNEIDLILQDIYLEEKDISGSDLAELYFDVAPQAIVFFLTSMDVETLAASGHDLMVDRIVAKGRIEGLMKYYYERFQELYGSMLWQVFVKAKERKEHIGVPELSDRTSVRKLLANIRTWTMEPKILFHGFALPEMVDHEFRHTSGLWKMTDRILGSFLDRHRNAMTPDEIVMLSLAVWLHDIGHRGDEFHSSAAEIRENHGSISESLILKHYKALGIDWLIEFCSNPTELKKDPCKGLGSRNNRDGCFGDGICPLRTVGLLCRYHQSTAPLKADRVADLILALKKPSPYCIIKMDDFKKEAETGRHQADIREWLKTGEDTGWFSADIRTLDEFDKGKWVGLAGMLRWLDALHTHSEKVGSRLCVESFKAYLHMRRQYCEDRIDEINRLLDATTAGSEAYIKFLAERMRLDNYSRLLGAQDVHQWRSGMVRDIYGEWSWKSDEKRWEFRIIFELFESDPFSWDTSIQKIIGKFKAHYKEEDTYEIWARLIGKKVIGDELESQKDTPDSEPYFEKYFKGVPLCYSWRKSGNDEKKDILIEEKRQ